MDYSKNDIDRFFEGKLSKKEAKDFLNWLDSPAGEETYNAIIEDIWSADSGSSETSPEIEDPHIPIFQDKNPSLDLTNPTKRKGLDRKPQLIKISLGLAAALTLIFSVSYIFYVKTPEQQNSEIIAYEAPLTIERSTPRGNKKIVTLPDGSTVVLNAASKLTYSSDFTENRTIMLEGEGFFEVVRDEQHPFTVITENIATTALGTSFNIKAYQGNPNIEVTLASGKVRVENNLNQNLFEINPGEAVYYSEENKTLKRQKADLQEVLGWKDGILQFHKTPFNLVVEDLGRWYGVNIEVKGTDQIPEVKCSGTFKPHEYLSNVLKVLSYSVDFEYTINGNDVILEFKQ
jgi:ferric-dicitrate binding protein FerR (iron transport regulator)